MAGHPRSRHVGVWVQRPSAEVYAFAAQAENLPRWASGLAGASVTWNGSAWSTESPMGEITFTFAPMNDFGVLDHDVHLPDGKVITNPLRVLAHGQASELVFTLRQLPGMSDDEFQRDAATVEADLTRLKTLLEG